MATQAQYTIRGRVAHVDAGGCFAFIEPLDQPLPEGVRTNRRGGFYMPIRRETPVPFNGATGTFVIVPGDHRGWNVRRVVQWDDVSAGSVRPAVEPNPPPGRSSGNSFIHPYNFVRFPDQAAMAAALQIAPFARGSAAPHDRYDPQLRTGYIDCELTMHTDWFIPDPRKFHKPNDHATLGYFTLDAVDPAEWQRKPPAEDTTRPAIPASSLRGMVRSVFEAATLSCLGIFDPGRMDYRLGRDLEDASESAPHGRHKPRYVPCRIERPGDGGMIVQLLDGRREDDIATRDNPPVLRMALIHAYEKSVRYRTNPRDPKSEVSGSVTRIFSDLVTLPDESQWRGNRVAVVIDANARKLTNTHRFRVREVLAAVRAEDDVLSAAELNLLQSTIEAPSASGVPDPRTGSRRKPHVVFGYLHRTGPNIENKHHERVFFRWAEYNQIGSRGTIAERFARFVQDQANGTSVSAPDIYCSVPAPVFGESLERLQNYAERQPGKDAKLLENSDCHPPRMISDPRAPQARLPYPSDFVRPKAKNIVWKPGDTCYALLEGEGPDAVIHGLYPVALPRLNHEHSRGDLLPPDFYPCAAKHRACPECQEADQLCQTCVHRPFCLCPACRVFGWVRDPSGMKASADPKRCNAWAGHVRFTHGVYLSGDCQAKTIPLPILGSPKPTTTMFYLRPEEGMEDQTLRWPPALQKLRQPLYRDSEAGLRGRKFYRRRLHTSPSSQDAAAGGLRRPDDRRDNQNQTVSLLPGGSVFKFRVHFDNLTDEELGGILFAISLALPECWRPGLPSHAKLCHSLGHGRPLGMGACSIRIQSLMLDEMRPEEQQSRYRSLAQKPAVANPLDFITGFGRAWSLAEKNAPQLEAVRGDLLEMLRCDWPNDGQNRIHYPPPPSGKFDENYRWFVENIRPASTRRAGGACCRLPEPQPERTDASQRLPIDPRR